MTNRKFLTSVAALSLILRVFDPGKAGWKMSADGKTIELKDGLPIYIDAQGNEKTFDPDHVTRLNGEAATHRKRADDAEKALKVFEGIDVTAAKKAIDLVKNIDAKKLIDAGEVDKVRAEISTQFTEQLNTMKSQNGELQSQLDGLKIDSVFAQSDFVRNNIALPPDIFQAYFRSNFKIKDGKIEAVDKAGNRLMSQKEFGNPASPDEALEMLVQAHPQKAMILKANTNNGSGNNGNGGGRNQGRIIKRAEFVALTPQQQAAASQQALKGEVSIVD